MESHLLQMRGLKLKQLHRLTYIFLSHLLQMRGLKQETGKPVESVRGRIFYRCVD